MAEINLSDLFSAISLAMTDAQEAVTRSTLDRYWNYFRQTGNLRGKDASGNALPEDALVPLMRKVVIPRPGEKGVLKEMDVPLVTLVPHNTFSLDQVKLKMRVSASVDEASGGAMKVSLMPLPRRKENDAVSDGENAAGSFEEPGQEIELVFRREAPPEGISRITTEAVKLL